MVGFWRTVLWLLCGLHLGVANSLQAAGDRFLVTQAAAAHLAYVAVGQGVTGRVEVGTAPYGIALDRAGRAYVATAEGVAVVDVARRQRLALIPYRSEVGRPGYGEYRHGGMGIAVTPDGARVYVAVYLGQRPSRLEVIDTATRQVIGEAELGVRPFQLLLSPDGRELYSIDHDSYSVTVVALPSLQARTLAVAPLGYAPFDKPHYAAIDSDGQLLLPVQGKVLARLDPRSGRLTTTPLSADTHQHGIALSADASTAYVVGTGPAGSAAGEPSLGVIDLRTGRERLLPLQREHEQVALSSDGRFAVLSGGNSFTGGWNGLSRVNLASGEVTQIAVPDQPLEIVRWPTATPR